MRHYESLMKRESAVLLLLLLVMFVSIPRIGIVNAWTGVIYIQADGSVDPPTAPIQRNGSLYTFLGNITTDTNGIVIEKDHITLDGSGYALIFNSTGLPFFPDYAAINLTGRSNVTIKNVKIESWAYGIRLWGSSNISIVENDLTAIVKSGITLSSSSNCNLIENNINGRGVWLVQSSNNIIFKNNINGSEWAGISLGAEVWTEPPSSNQNTIFGNNITNNEYGIRVRESQNNRIYHNNFINNTNQVFTYNSISVWDDGYPSGGNYWSDYVGVDSYRGQYQNETGSDGIVDTSYRFDADNVDRYPLLNAISSVPAYPIANFTYFPSNPIASQTVVFNASNSTCQNGTIETYYWNFGDGTDGFGEVANHSYPVYGSYNVTLTVYSNTRHTGKQTQLVTIRGKPTASFHYIPTVNVTVGQSVTFDASSSTPRGGTIETYIWDFGDENETSTTDPIVIHTYPIAKTYNVSLTVLDSESLNSSCFQLVKVRIPSFISISTSSSSSLIGFAVEINGTLYDTYGNGLGNQTVLLQYTFSGANTWVPITSDTTDQLGKYHINWIPPATGYFTVEAVWTGNNTHFGTNNTISLSTIPYQNQSIFSIESNSTISALTFNSTSLELSFTVSGETGTKGYVKATIAKSIISNIANIKVYLDGNPTEYSTISQDDAWTPAFTYTHSTHYVTIDLKSVSTTERPTELTLWSFILIVAIIIVIALLAGIIIIKRRNRGHKQ